MHFFGGTHIPWIPSHSKNQSGWHLEHNLNTDGGGGAQGHRAALKPDYEFPENSFSSPLIHPVNLQKLFEGKEEGRGGGREVKRILSFFHGLRQCDTLASKMRRRNRKLRTFFFSRNEITLPHNTRSPSLQLYPKFCRSV